MESYITLKITAQDADQCKVYKSLLEAMQGNHLEQCQEIISNFDKRAITAFNNIIENWRENIDGIESITMSVKLITVYIFCDDYYEAEFFMEDMALLFSKAKRIKGGVENEWEEEGRLEMKRYI